MEENTAFSIAREWLPRTKASDDGVRPVADALQRVVVEPKAHAVAEDSRLALLADNDLYIVTVETDDVTTVKIERADLSSERVRPSLSETYEEHFDTLHVYYVWRIECDVASEPLEFKAKGLYTYKRESDDPALALWWRLAEATGWTRPK